MYPVPGHAGLDINSDSGAAAGLITELIRGHGVATQESPGGYIAGVHEVEEGRLELLDRWWKPYQVIMDTNRDGVVADPSAPDRKLKENVIVWSGGPDGDPNTWNDNAATWLELK